MNKGRGPSKPGVALLSLDDPQDGEEILVYDNDNQNWSPEERGQLFKAFTRFVICGNEKKPLSSYSPEHMRRHSEEGQSSKDKEIDLSKREDSDDSMALVVSKGTAESSDSEPNKDKDLYPMLEDLDSLSREELKKKIEKLYALNYDLSRQLKAVKTTKKPNRISLRGKKRSSLESLGDYSVAEHGFDSDNGGEVVDDGEGTDSDSDRTVPLSPLTQAQLFIRRDVEDSENYSMNSW